MRFIGIPSNAHDRETSRKLQKSEIFAMLVLPQKCVKERKNG